MVFNGTMTLDLQIIMSWQGEEDSSSDSIDIDPNAQRSRLQSIWNSIRASKTIGQRFRESNHPRMHPNISLKQSLPSSPDIREESERDRGGEVNELVRQLRQTDRQNKQLQFEIEQMRRAGNDRNDAGRSNNRNRVSRGRDTHKQNQRNAPNMGQQHTVIEQYQAQIDRLTLRIKALEQQNKALQEEVSRLTQFYQLQSRQHTTQGGNEQGVSCMIEGAGQQLLQLSEARQTISRLVELLRQYGGREEWSWLGEGKELHYMKNILRRAKRGQIEGYNGKNGCGCGGNVRPSEKRAWTPTECYRVMLQLKMKYDYLSEDCIEQVLFQMNNIYLHRQQSAIQQLKNQYTQQLSKLKRKHQQNYNEALAKKQITRLKKELTTAKSTQKGGKGKLEGLKDRGEYEDQLRLKERELKLLRERMRLLEAERGANEKGLYYQGVVWGVEKLLGELGQAQGSLKQFQVQFRERLQDCLDVQDWLRSYKDFFEALTEQNHALVQRLLTIKQTALSKLIPSCA